MLRFNYKHSMACYQTLASPVAPPLDLLLRRAKREHVRHVMVHGKWVVRDGRPTLVDEEACVAAMRDELAYLTAEELAESAAAAVLWLPICAVFMRLGIHSFLQIVLTQDVFVATGQTSGKGATAGLSYGTVHTPFPEVWLAPA